MKKLYLSITLLGIIILMFMIILIPVQAYTFNGSYDFNDIDLDDSISELNGASLNDLFDYDYLETIPLIEYNGFRNKFELFGDEVVFNEYLYIDLGYKNLFDKTTITRDIYITDGNATITSIGDYESDFISIKPSTNYIKNGASFIVFYDSNKNFISGLVGTSFTTPTNAYFLRMSGSLSTIDTVQLELGSTATNYVPFGQLSEIYRINTTPIQNTDIFQSLIVNNLETMDIDLINYYFAVFLLHKFNLPVDDLWNYAFDAGELSGYQDGYDDGQYDWGVLLPDESGYFDPEDASEYYFNEGRDDAIDNNLTLMGLFELMIGVVLSMVGWIINIEIFEISIIGILSTLAVGIGFIWFLKILRG
jgi:hypothetical protein